MGQNRCRSIQILVLPMKEAPASSLEWALVKKSKTNTYTHKWWFSWLTEFTWTMGMEFQSGKTRRLCISLISKKHRLMGMDSKSGKTRHLSNEIPYPYLIFLWFGCYASTGLCRKLWVWVANFDLGLVGHSWTRSNSRSMSTTDENGGNVQSG